MNRDRFIRQRRDDWQQLESVLARLRDLRAGRWLGTDIEMLARLYRSVCCDLSLVQSREWGRRLEVYLNDLVAQGHGCLYRSPPGSLRTLLEFVAYDFPRLLRGHWKCLVAALMLFAIPLITAGVIAAIDPVFAERLVDQQQLEHARLMYSNQHYRHFDETYADDRSRMTGYYIQNNVGIAFRTFALGILAGVGTVCSLLFNGLTLGAVMGYLVHAGLADNFFSFAISHGSFELTAIVVAGAAGLLLGWGMIHPGQRSRLDSLRHHGSEAVRLAFGAGVMLLIAAGIEAWFSPLPTPHIVKYVVGLLLWVLVAVWLGFGGREIQGDEN
ncbi:MAG: stage II sporulation protein M [Planctomycetaceae bacterium]|jgi:uncharacterized membrane protein SpoIIM required for sporulation